MTDCSHPEDMQMVEYNIDINDNVKITRTICGKCMKTIKGEK